MRKRRTKRVYRKWDEWYAIAKDYYETHGDLLVPQKYRTPDGAGLGEWIASMRCRYKGNPGADGYLYGDQIEMLERIGMVWQINELHPWEKWFALAQEYYKEHGDLLVHRDCVRDGMRLGNWVGEQRTKYSRGKLTQKQVGMLEGIGMVWSVFETRPWDEWYADAKAYYEEHGDLNVMERYETKDGNALGRWLYRQKQIYRGEEDKGMPLTEERTRRLEAIGIDWDTVRLRSWDEWYALAREYYEAHGDLLVPKDYATPDGARLGDWIVAMRGSHSGKENARPLTEEQERLLSDIGMEWQVKSQPRSWEEWLAIAAAYYEEHGNLAVKVHYVTADGAALGRWIAALRASRSGTAGAWKLTDERLRQVEAIGMVWNASDGSRERWEKWFSIAEAHYKKHGSLVIPKGYVTEDGEALGEWIYKQRRSYKGTARFRKLSGDEIKRLEAIGMVWTVTERTGWDEAFTYAKAYYEEHGDLLVKATYRCDDGFRLGWWIVRQRQRREGKGTGARLTAEQAARLDSIGMVWHAGSKR